MDDRLDFEEEDRLLFSSTPRPADRRRKVIGLDDLLSDYYKEGGAKSKSINKLKRKISEANISDDEENSLNCKERQLSEFVEDCQKVHELNAEEDIPLWGQNLFGLQQKAPPPSNFIAVEGSQLLQSCRNEINMPVDLSADKGVDFLEGLLRNGWLSKLVIACGFLEDAIAYWTFYMMLYSSDKELQQSACDIWCGVLSSQAMDGKGAVTIRWLPKYSDLMVALEIYGYRSETSNGCPSSLGADSGLQGPPLNIISWIKFLSACCQFRTHPMFSTFEAEEFLGVVILFSLDRVVQGLTFSINKCMLSLIDFFMDEEWNASCKRVAESVSHRIPKDSNCLRLVEYIPGTNRRSKQIKSVLAFQILLSFFDGRVTDEEDMLNSLISVNVKDKECDFFRLYMYLVLVENWLSFYESFEEGPELLETWSVYLRKCSSQISSTDWRPFALKVRSRASFLLQNSMQRRKC